MSKRIIQIDWIRAIATIQIVIHHCVVNNLGLQNVLTKKVITECNPKMVLLILINCFCVGATSLFFLCSGYCRIKKPIKNAFNVVLECFIVYTIVNIIGVLTKQIELTDALVKKNIKFLDTYWFIGVYFLLALISPLINLVIEHIDKKTYIKYCVGIFMLFCICSDISSQFYNINHGRSLLYAAYLYFVGAGLQKFNIKIKKDFLFYLILCLLNFSIITFIYLNKNGKKAWEMFYIYKPLIFLSTVLFFNKITTTKLPESKMVSFIASSSILSYLLLSTCWLTTYRSKIVSIFKKLIGFYGTTLLLPILSLVLVLIVSVIYKSFIYQKIVLKPIDRLYQFIDKFISKSDLL